MLPCRRRRAQESSPQQGRAPSESNPQQQLQELPDLADTPVLQVRHSESLNSPCMLEPRASPLHDPY